MTAPEFEVHPLTPDRWDDLETLFGPQGACAGCWCMWFRTSRAEYRAGRGEGNRQALHNLVESGAQPGLIGYVDGVPVAWVSLAPREDFSRLARSRNLKRIDEQPVWSVVCFFTHREFRGRRLMRRMLEAAAEYARSQGATLLEGYPLDPSAGTVSADDAFVGLDPVFREAGFAEAARRTPKQAIFRKVL